MALQHQVQKVLVTGASGFIASHIVKQLQEAGYKVRGTVRSLSNPKKVEPLRNLCPSAAHELELVEADLTNEECWKDAVQGCSHVIHTASPFPAKNPSNENEVIGPAVQGTTRVLQACVDVGGVQRVVLTSSTKAVSEKPGADGALVTEETWCDVDGFGKDAYGKSKVLAEQAAWEFVKNLPADSKLELAVINPGLVLGPVLCGTPGTSVELVRRILIRDLPMIPHINFAVCDVRDVARAHIVAMTAPEAAGHRHLISPHNLWFLDMATILRAEFRDKGYNPSTTVAPYWILKTVSFVDSSVRYISHLHGIEVKFSDQRLHEVLGITPHHPKDSLIDMAYSCIDKGFIVRRSAYVSRQEQSQQTVLANANETA